MVKGAVLLLLGAGLLFAEDDKGKPKPEERKVDSGRRAKRADAWVEKFSKGGLPDSVPRWSEVFEALERKHGKGKVPCGTFDSAREKYFEEFVRPWLQKEGYGMVGGRDVFMKGTDLPTTWTLVGRKRAGCLED